MCDDEIFCNGILFEFDISLHDSIFLLFFSFLFFSLFLLPKIPKNDLIRT